MEKARPANPKSGFFPTLGTVNRALLASAMDLIDFLRKTADVVNAKELSARRKYYQYLVDRGENDETLDEHLARFASLAAFETSVAPATLTALQAMSGPQLPPDLKDFYLAVGGFKGGSRLKGLTIPSPARLCQCAESGTAKWERLSSIGLVDVIRWSWGNDRFEFDPASGEGLSSEQVASLNRRYSAVGFQTVEGGEGFEYLYFDDEGRFGVLFYHQDAFDELYEDDLSDMLVASKARSSLLEGVLQMIATEGG